MLPLQKLAGIISNGGTLGPIATAFTLSLGSSSGTTGNAVTVTVTPNGYLSGSCTVTLACGTATLGTTSLSFAGSSNVAQSTTLTPATDATHTVTMTNSLGLTNSGSPASYTSSAPSPSADWLTRSTGASVVWAHNFDYDAEVTKHMQTPDPTSCPVPLRRTVDSTGIGCLEQIVLGAMLSADYTAGDTVMHLNDVTYWPDPAVTGAFYFEVCRQDPSVGTKNLFRCTARSGTTLTVAYVDMTGVSAFLPYTANNYFIGDYAGNEAGDWRRTFAALPSGENGLPTDDAGASGAVPLRSKLSGNGNSVPRDPSIWQYGFYGHTSNQSTWANWTPWSGATTYTPRGTSQGVAAKYRLWDGNEFYIQFRLKIDPRFWSLNTLPDPNGQDSYFGRKSWALQSEVSSVNQLVSGISPSNRYAIPTTPESPFSLLTYKASRIIGVSDYSRSHTSYQMNSPWDVAPHYADLSSSFKPSTGCATPDGSAAWEYKSNEWVTFLIRVKPGRSNVAETEIDVKFARTEAVGYDGTYTTLMSVTDANIVYSGSGDYDFPDGSFTSSTVAVMDALPGFQSFGIMGYLNTFQTAGIPPAKGSYYVRMAQVIFSKATIPAPQITSGTPLPSWVPAAGSVAVLTTGNGLLTNTFGSQVASYYEPFFSVKIVNDYSGSVVNPYYGTYGSIIFEGGGHAATNDNSVIQLELGASNCTFRRIVNPTPIYGSGSDSTTRGNNSSISDASQYSTDWFEYSDGKPADRHSYDDQVVIGPSQGGAAYGTFQRFLVTGTSHAGLPNGEVSHKIDFNAMGTTLNWARAGSLGISLSTSPVYSDYVASQNRTYVHTIHRGSIRWFDHGTTTFVAGTGTALADDADGPPDGSRMFSVPSRNLLLFCDAKSGNLRIRWMDVSVSQPSWVNTGATLSTTLAVDSAWSAACWCPDNNKIIVAIPGDTTGCYEIDIPSVLTNTWTVTRAAYGGTGSITPAPSNTYKKWSYNSKIKAIAYMPYADSGSTNDTVYVYRPRGT